MKKLFASILLLIYFVVSTGFTVNLHYCMDKFHSWQLGNTDSEKCATCGMTTLDGEGCCRDEVKTVKLQQDLLETKSVAVNFFVPTLVSHVASILITPFQNWSQFAEPNNAGPPLLSKQETYLDNCVFRL